MSAISNPIVTASENITEPCLLFNITLSFEWDTNIAPQESQLLCNIFQGFELPAYSKTFDNSDIVSNVGGVLTYEKDFSITRKTQDFTNFNIRNATSTHTLNFFEDTLVSQWSIESIVAITGIDSLGTITIETFINTQTLDLGLMYSIDDITYVSTNVLTGIAPGDYTAYVRDNYGCKQTKNFTIVETPVIGQRNNFRFVSLLNSVPFTRANQGISNFDNTPSYEIDVENKIKDFTYDYKGGDKLEFQFRSNYDINKAYLLNCGEVVNELTVEQKTDNLNNVDIRDMKDLFIDGFLHMYNIGGKIYDKDDNIIGDNELNGLLLDAQQVGTVVSVEGLGLLEILDIITLPSGDLAIKLNYQGTISGLYNKVTTYLEPKINFEVFQFDFTIPENDSIDKRYQIALVMNLESGFDNQNPLSNASYISEVILPFQSQKMHRFIWKNIENNQINWDTGIQCIAYFPYDTLPIFVPKDDNDVYMTDTSSRMLEGDVYETYTFNFDVLSQIQCRQLSMITSVEYLYIDDIFYTKEETPEFEALIGSNGYKAEINLTVASNYNSNSTTVSLDALGVLPEDLRKLFVLIVDGNAIILNNTNGLFI